MIPQAFLWDGGINLGGTAHSTAPDTGLFHALDLVIGYIGTAGALGAIIALMATAIGQRWLRIGRGTARLTATWSLATATVVPLTGFTMLALTGGLTVTLVLSAIALMAAPFALVALSAQRTLAAC